MGRFGALRPRVGTGVAMSVMSASLLFAAIRTDGYHATNVDLNDGAVWVYNGTRQWVSRVNTQTAEVESMYQAVGTLDLQQDGTTVYARTSGSLVRFIPSTGEGVASENWPEQGVVGLGGGVGALLDRGSGNAWVTQGLAIGNWKPSLEPTLKVSQGSLLVVSPAGVAIVVDPTTDDYTVVTLDDQGAAVVGEPVAFGADVPTDLPIASLTAVGNQPVVLTDQGVLLAGGQVAAVDAVGANPVLQEPSDAGSTVAIAGDKGLAEIDLSDGTSTLLAESSAVGAARPIRHGSCISAAWSNPGRFSQTCANRPLALQDIPDFTQGSPLLFRLNGTALVLAGAGDEQWVVRDGRLIRIENWAQADPKLNNDKEQQAPTPTETEDQTERTCKAGQIPPVAKPVPFEYGAKPDTTIVIDVISNFDDANCDPLAAINVTTSADVAGVPSRAAPINFGQSIQFHAPPEEGVVTISFTISDGTPANDLVAEMTVDVVNSSDHVPEPKDPSRRSRTTVQQNKSVSYNILTDWIDRDGDLVSLASASVASPADGRVVFGADGLITYTAETTTGVKTIAVVVQDEVGHTNSGTLEVVVQPPGPIPPVARDDYASGRVGQEVSVAPTLNDTDANIDPGQQSSDLTATVLRDGLPAELQVVGPDSAGVVLLSASAPGTYVIRYSLSDGSGKTSAASIRFDVVAADAENQPPVAVRDSVVIREGRTANVDVLSNDADPNGDVIAVVDAAISPANLADDGTARAVVIDRRYVRVEIFKRPPTPTFTINYRITDGLSDPVVGQLLVTVPQTAGNQYPITQTDRAVVRVNQVISISVLANDRDPDGDQLYIVPGSVKLDPGSPGYVWLDGTTVRYKAGPESQTAPIVVRYEVEDDPAFSGLQRVAGNVLIRVIGADDQNDPPVPPPGELRVFAGAKATFRVPLSGIDPDGDTVVISSISQQGTKGVAELVGDTIVYTAGGEPGADQFTYVVRDSGGLEGNGVVRVVIATGEPHSPVPINDHLRVRPGRLVSVNVLANDTDPDGDQIRLLDELGVTDPVTASVNGTRVDVQVPPEPGTYVVTYQVNDDRSQQPQQATITIVADPEAPLLAPVTRDDPDSVKSPAVRKTLKDANGVDVVVTDIAVLGNDDDPDGSPSDLAASIVPGQAGVQDGAALLPPVAPGSIRVVMADVPQWVVYQAADLDNNVSSAVAKIEANINEPPKCPAQDVPVATATIPGDPVRIVIADLVKDPEGDPVQLEGEEPTLTPLDGKVNTTKGDFAAFSYRPNELTQLTSVLVSVKVQDRRPSGNNNVVTCFLQIAIKRLNEAPVVKDASFQVEQQVSPSLSLGNLTVLGFAADADSDTLTFTQTSPAAQNDVTLTIGATGDLTVAAKKAPVGKSLTFTYTVTDGNASSGAPKVGKVVLNVVTTTRPPPAVQSFTLADIEQGKPIDQNVAAGAFDPFPEQPMTYTVDPSPAEGSGSVSIDAGNVVTFAPAADFFGRAVVRFTATDYVERTSSGTITYTVIGKPKAPGQPTVTDVSSHRAVLSWAPADPQGAPITDYIVRWPGGEKSSGTATSITIDTLTNGVDVQFTVTARNKVGDSDPSAQSGAVRPDQIPPKPVPPVITTFDDKSLTVTWAEVVPDGTPIIRYDLYISAGGAPQQLSSTDRSFTWTTGLSNGTPYTFSIVAVNSAGASERSDASNSLSPATKPDAPTNVVAADVGVAIESRVQLSWTRPADNGRPIIGYRVFDNGTLVPGYETNPATTASFPLTPGDHSFSVIAINVVGDSPVSAASPPKTFAQAPSSPTLAGASSDEDRQVTVSFAPLTGAETGGCAISTYQYELGGSGSWADLAPSNVISGLTNGTTYSVRVRAVNCKPSVQSNPSGAASAKPSGPPIGANISVGGSQAGNSINWSWNATNAANGSPIVSVQLSNAVNAGVGLSGSTSSTPGCGQTQVLAVTVQDAVGRQASAQSGPVSTAPCPPPTYSVVTNAFTCPEPNFVAPSNFNGGSCNGDKIGTFGFIPTGTALVVDCAVFPGPSWIYASWYHIVAGGPGSGFVADATVNGSVAGIRAC